jgi:SAM-dependent methyltransferase
MRVNPANCKACSRELIRTPILRFENMPGVAQNFPDAQTLASDRGVDLEVFQCSGCGLVQLDMEPVPYFRDVIRAAGFSPDMGKFRRSQFTEFLKKYSLSNRKIIEIGCGRGEYASLMQECGGSVYGLEHSAESVAECMKKGLRVTQGFLDDRQQKIPGGPFDAFFVLNFLEHIPDLSSFLQGIAHNLSEGAVGLVEVPNFDMILRDQMFCEFMTDHLYYFTKESLRTVLSLNGFEVIECGEVWHSYILSAVVKKRARVNLQDFDGQRKKLEQDLQEYVGRFPPLSVATWGAGHQALATLSLSKLQGKIKYVVDSAPFKQGKFTPATHLPIVSPDAMMADKDLAAIIVMGASYSDEIVRDLQSKYKKKVSIAVLRSNHLETIETTP